MFVRRLRRLLTQPERPSSTGKVDGLGGTHYGSRRPALPKARRGAVRFDLEKSIAGYSISLPALSTCKSRRNTMIKGIR